jgi:hypothetical protein
MSFPNKKITTKELFGIVGTKSNVKHDNICKIKNEKDLKFLGKKKKIFIKKEHKSEEKHNDKDDAVFEDDNKKIKEKARIKFSFLTNFQIKILKNYTCAWCNKISIRIYRVNIKQCGHLFCYNCLAENFQKNDKIICPKCSFFYQKEDIIFDKVVAIYIESFLPENNILPKNKPNNFIQKYFKKIEFIVQPAEYIGPNTLPRIKEPYNRFSITIPNQYYDIINEIKANIFFGLFKSGYFKDNSLSFKNICIIFNKYDITKVTNYKVLLDNKIDLPGYCELKYKKI